MAEQSAVDVPSVLGDEERDLLIKLLALHYVNPLPYPLAGAYFEELFATAIDGKREERKLLFDVHRAGIGWSLKTAQQEKRRGDTFEIVLQRCDILKDRSVSLQDPVEDLGRKVVNHFNGFHAKSVVEQEISDPRAAFLIRNRSAQRFIFFQCRYQIYRPEEVVWSWANDENRSLMGRVEGKLVYRWYRSGTQLFAVYPIPTDAHEFEISWRRADLDATLAYFASQGLTEIRLLP